MWGGRAPFLLRRMASSWLLPASLVLTVFITCALLCAMASFGAQVLPQAARRDLLAAPRTSVLVSGQVDAPAAAADRVAVRSVLRAAFGPVPFRLDSAMWSDPLQLPAAPGGRAIPLTEAAAPGQIRTHTTLVAGRWPGRPRPGQAMEGALPATVARQLGLAPGAVLTLRDRSTLARFRVRVSGLFTLRDPASGYWGLDLIGAAGVSAQPGFTTYGPLVVDAAAFGRGALPVGAESWVAQPDVAAIAPGDLTGLAARIGRAGSYLQGSVRLGGLELTTGLPPLLDGLSASIAVARSMLAISALELLLLAAAALALAARLLAVHREEENALLSSRGAARWQLARITVAETLPLAALAAAGGAVAGHGLAGLLLRAGSLRDARLSRAGFPASAWLAVALVLVLCLAVTLFPALRPGTPGTARARRGRQAVVAGVARSGGDIALVVLAVLAVHELRAYSAVAHLGAGGLGLDPVLAAAPALALAAVSLILLRLLPLAARGLEALITRSRRLGVALASWEISRRAVRQSGPVLLAVLAVATGTLALAQYQSWRQSARDQAAFWVGADVRVDAIQPATLGQAGAISHLPGVTAVMPVSRLTDVTSGTVLAIDARHAAGTVLLRPDLSAVPAAALWRKITPPAQPGLALPGRPARLEIIASAASARGAAALGQLPATATLQDGSGTVYSAPAGTLRADGRRHALIIELSAARRASYPLHLLGLSLAYSLPSFPGSRPAALAASRPATVTLWALALSPGPGGRFAAPFAGGSALAGWRTTLSAAGLTGLAGLGARDAAPTLGRWQPAAGGGQQLSFLPGHGPDLAVLARDKSFTGALTGYEGALTLAPRYGTVVTGIATRAFLAAQHVRLGDLVPLAIPGAAAVPVRIVAAVAAFPTIGPGGGLVVDQGTIQDLLASAGDTPLPVTQGWLRTTGGTVPRGLPAGSAVASRARLQASLLGNSLAAAPLLEGLALAVAAAVLAAVGFSAGVAASLRGRRSQSALLAALGYTRAARARGLCLEELLLTGPAALAGLVAGVGLAHVLIPALTLTTAAAVTVPAVAVVTPLGWAALLALAVAATPVVVAVAAVARRPDPAAQLRAAEAA
jgi:hypothetical protein